MPIWVNITSENWPQCSTSEELVEHFLEYNKYWFSESSNSLYGKRGIARKHLLDFLKGNEDQNPNSDLIYVETKFDVEWLCNFAKIS